MRRARPRAASPGLAVLGAVAVMAAACGGGHTASAGTSGSDCAAVVQAADAIRIETGTALSPSDAMISEQAADDLTSAAAKATTAVAGPAGQLAAAARSYADALRADNREAANTAGGLLRQRAQAVADVCKETVLGVAPSGPIN